MPYAVPPGSVERSEAPHTDISLAGTRQFSDRAPDMDEFDFRKDCHSEDWFLRADQHNQLLLEQDVPRPGQYVETADFCRGRLWVYPNTICHRCGASSVVPDRPDFSESDSLPEDLLEYDTKTGRFYHKEGSCDPSSIAAALDDRVKEDQQVFAAAWWDRRYTQFDTFARFRPGNIFLATTEEAVWRHVWTDGQYLLTCEIDSMADSPIYTHPLSVSGTPREALGPNPSMNRGASVDRGAWVAIEARIDRSPTDSDESS